MDILVQTDFFQAISQNNAYEIETAYSEFIYKIFEICHNKIAMTYGELTFTLSNTNIELMTIKEANIHSTSVLTQMYVNKAIRFTETAQRFIIEHKDQYLPTPTDLSSVNFNHKWTAKPIFLTEIIYALQSYKCIDNGDITVDELANLLGCIFNIDLKNINISYNDIKKRNKESRTYFLDELSDVLNQRMSSDDDKKDSRR